MFAVGVPEIPAIPLPPPPFGCRGCKCFIWLLLGPDKSITLWMDGGILEVDHDDPGSYWPACKMRDGDCFALHECRPECDDWNQTPRGE